MILADPPSHVLVESLNVLALVGAAVVLSRYRWGTVVPGICGLLFGALALLPCWGWELAAWQLLGLWTAVVVAHGCIWQTAFAERQQAGVGTRRLWLLGGLLLALAPFTFVPWPLSWMVALVGLFTVLLDDVFARTCVGRSPRPVAGGPAILNSLFGYTVFLVVCSTAAACFPLLILLPRRWQRTVLFGFTRAGMHLIFISAPTVRFGYRDPAGRLEGARLAACNHEGMLDILGALALPGRRTTLARRWVFRMPFLGWAAKAFGAIDNRELAVEPQDAEHARRILGRAEGLVVFPEGHRSPDGLIHRFHQGGFALARTLGEPVVPVAIAGSFTGIRKGSLWIHPTVMVAAALPPLEHEAGETANMLARRCRRVITAARGELSRELFAHPRFLLRRRQQLLGLPAAWRRAFTTEYAAGAWRLLLRYAPLLPGRWLLLGTGWGSFPLVLKDLLPTARVRAWEPDPRRRQAALSSWATMADRIADSLALLPRSGYHACCCRLAPPEGWDSLASRLEGCRMILLPEGEVDALRAAVPGFVRRDAADGFVVLAREEA